MRIVANPEFLTLPDGTLYCRFDGANLDVIEIKGQSDHENNDFLFQGLFETISSDWQDRATGGNPVGTKFDLAEQDLWGRDGLYDEDEMYAVFEPADVQVLINRLLRCQAQAYKVA